MDFRCIESRNLLLMNLLSDQSGNGGTEEDAVFEQSQKEATYESSAEES